MRRGGGVARAAAGSLEEEDRERRMRKAGASLFIRKDANRRAQKSRENRIMVIQLYRRLDSRETLKIKDPLEDDVM